MNQAHLFHIWEKWSIFFMKNILKVNSNCYKNIYYLIYKETLDLAKKNHDNYCVNQWVKTSLGCKKCRRKYEKIRLVLFFFSIKLFSKPKYFYLDFIWIERFFLFFWTYSQIEIFDFISSFLFDWMFFVFGIENFTFVVILFYFFFNFSKKQFLFYYML